MPFHWTQIDTRNAVLTSLIPGSVALVGLNTIYRDNATQKWLESLRKPTWAPSNFKACSVLDIATMLPLGYATYRIFKYGGGFDYTDTTIALGLFGTNMLLNLGTLVHVKKRNLRLLHYNTLLVSLTAFASAITYYYIDKPASYYLIPYCLWTGFHTVLSYYLWQGNTAKNI